MDSDHDDLAALKKARSLLLILLATSRETLLALEAVGNVLDSELADDLKAMIARSEDELESLGRALSGIGVGSGQA